MNQKRSYILIVLGIFLVVGCAIYWAGLNGAYFGDDFNYVFHQPSSKAFHFFLHANPNATFYRPIESMVLAVVQTYFATATWPIHLLVLLSHIMLSFLVYYATVELGFSRLQGSLAGAYMLVSQANAMAVLSNDTLSQVAGTLFGYCSLWTYYRFQVSNQVKSEVAASQSRHLYIASLLFFTVSIWMKETSLSFLLAVIILALTVSAGNNQFSLRKNAVTLLPYVLITMIYVLIRSLAVSGQPDDRYTLLLGLNIIVNVAETLYSAFLPVSSVALYSAFTDGNTLVVFAITGISITIVAVVILGVVRSRTSLVSLLLIVLTLATMFPMALFKHVSELYAYNSMPTVSMLLGIGLVTFANQFIQRKLFKATCAVLLAVLFASQVVSIQQKARLTTENGERASSLARQIIPYIASVPPNGTLVLLNPVNTRHEYSIFLMNDFNVLKYGTNIINSLSGRDDIHIRIVNEQERAKLPIPSGSLILSLVGNDVQRVQEIGSN
jgi:hypothetical protein